MTPIRILTALTLALGLSACVSNQPASRGATPVPPDLAAASSTSSTPDIQPGVAYLEAQYDVASVRVNVPRTLKVSEANTIKPRADIVWRGDPLGDRYEQVASIFNEAAANATSSMHNGRKVVVDIEVTRFHAVTERTRYTIGGMHEMQFIFTVRDAATGQVIDGPRPIIADARASGGAQAIAEENAGRTQRVVTVARLTAAIRKELSTPVPQDQLVSRLSSQMGLSPLAVTE